MQSRRPHILILLGIFAALFWLTGRQINVYQYAFIGSVFELLWLPMLLLLFGLPLISLYFWRKEKFSLRSLYFYSLIVAVTTVVLLVWKG